MEIEIEIEIEMTYCSIIDCTPMVEGVLSSVPPVRCALCPFSPARASAAPAAVFALPMLPCPFVRPCSPPMSVVCRSSLSPRLGCMPPPLPLGAP